MGYIENLDEALKRTVQFNYPLTWRIATASYSPEDQRRFMKFLWSKPSRQHGNGLKKLQNPADQILNSFPQMFKRYMIENSTT